ncbi:Fe-S cluster assembly protein SufD [Paucilactobacillus suebicus]|uniref:Iron sulfur ABC transporter n=1 Tax=Paucilactobacillus suebicus DSM 5007 = KCTC 3549 TaxID=1423807 RepID=A0A0R1W5H2_9LACO|nr:Fe-S cluster assembly protein SufD [Paucilactobacillus suebicus]KRM13006.1 iron sulfur ABC transporter [Paucilactobacillus suebicus DSM 5007 = KCTC 3549]
MPKSAVLALDPVLLSAAKFDDEPQWLTDLRQSSWDKAKELALPEFAKINYRHWPLLEFAQDGQTNTNIPDDIQAETESYNFVSVGKTTVKSAIPDDLVKQGVVFCDLQTAAKKHAELLSKYLFTKAIKPDEDRLTAVNASLMDSGVFLYVPHDVSIKEPISLLQVQDSRQKTNFVNHNVIVTDDNSSVQVLQRTETIGDAENPASVAVEVISGPGSHIKFSSLDSLSEKTNAYFNRRGHLEKDSEIDWTMGVLNDGNTIADFDSDLKGTGSHAEVQTVAISTGKQTQGIDTSVTNYGKHSEGNILQRGVLLEKSALVFNGVGKIIHGAHGSKAQQENRILMLSPEARGDANPILLIDENDVIAGHAASVGRVDQKQLYYLMSRGLTKEVAQRLVILGFLGVVLTEIPIAAVRNQMIAMIERKLINGQRTE